jgi:hypothetical protein
MRTNRKNIPFLTIIIHFVIYYYHLVALNNCDKLLRSMQLSVTCFDGHLMGESMRMPATHAVVKHEKMPPIRARMASFEKMPFRCGHIAEKQPNSEPIVEILEKPQSA